MKFVLWLLVLTSLVLADYKLLFNPVCVELFDLEDRLIARSFRRDAFHVAGRIRTAGCSPWKTAPPANHTILECFADDFDGPLHFRVAPDIPRGALPNVETVAFYLDDSK